jgi:hypothetical protein
VAKQKTRYSSDPKASSTFLPKIARALQEDEAHRQADLEEVAVEEAEAVPDWPPEC